MRIKRYAIIGFWTIPTIAKNSAGEINTRVNHVTYVRNELGANKANRNNNSDGVEFQWEAKEWLTRLIKTGPLMQDNAQSYKSANAKQGGGKYKVHRLLPRPGTPARIDEGCRG